MTKGVFSPQPLTPGHRTQRRRVRHLMRNRNPDKLPAKCVAVGGARSQSGGGRAVPPAPWASHATALSPGQRQDRGDTHWPSGGRLCLHGFSAWAPSPPPRCPNSTPAGAPVLSARNALVSVSKGCHIHAFARDRRTFRAFIPAAGRGPTSPAGCFVFMRDRPPAGRWGPGKGPGVPSASAWRIPTRERGAWATQTHTHEEPLP